MAISAAVHRDLNRIGERLDQVPRGLAQAEDLIISASAGPRAYLGRWTITGRSQREDAELS